MPRMSKRRKRELSFFLTESGRIAHNKLCLRCTHDCKQSDSAVVLDCPKFERQR